MTITSGHFSQPANYAGFMSSCADEQQVSARFGRQFDQVSSRELKATDQYPIVIRQGFHPGI
jgi:hypothetical protein